MINMNDIVKETVLSRVRYSISREIPKEDMEGFLGNTRVRAGYLSAIAGSMTIELSSSIFGLNRGHETVKWPKDWVEALTLRFAPAWLKNRCPVKYAYAVLDVWELVPSIPCNANSYITYNIDAPASALCPRPRS